MSVGEKEEVYPEGWIHKVSPYDYRGGAPGDSRLNAS